MNTRKASSSGTNSSQTGKLRKAKEKCGECSRLVKSEDKGIQCELCEAWFHSSCQAIDDEQYQALEADSQKDTPILH